ncbi:MAG: right-handed parallel beta-helix repeat-containing protein [Bosea sp. (in: a-proteobacteria)]
MAIYYVSPKGSDGQAGTLDRPFASLQYAHDLAKPGDTIYLRGGVYELTSGIQLTNDGSSGKPITITNYPGEKPILDGSRMTSDEYYGRSGAGGWVLDGSSISWNHISGLEVRGGPMGGVVIRDESHNNILERLDVHSNGRLSEWEGKGVSLYGPASNNLLRNIDSHDNRDLNTDNADGFHVSTTGSGNVLRANRAWGNSDDGFDFFNIQDGTRGAPVLIEGNWAFKNGFDASGNAAGDGNGFKLGGMRSGSGSESGGHTVVNNVAWSNASIGFDQNDASIDMKLYNNSAYNNGLYNYGFWSGDSSFINNVSAGSGKLSASGSGSSNSWNFASPTSADFISLSDATARGARAADGSLPASDFLHLSSSSKLIDKGVDVGRAYAGSAPDLGSFERGMTPAPEPAPIAPTPAPEPAPVAPPAPPAPTAPTVAVGKTFGTDLGDVLTGTSANNWMHGNAGADVIDGAAGNDSLFGGSENDILIGGPGADTMSGGAGRDTFVFRAASESGPGAGARDVIQWFERASDKLDLRMIDANTAVAGDQLFLFAGKTSAVEANSVSFFHSGKTTIVQGDVNGDGKADFQIELNEAINLGRDQFLF